VGQREEEPPQKEPSQWIAVAIHHLFGSEELSAHAPGIAGRMPRPYAALHPDDARALTLNEGSLIEVAVGNVRWNLPVRFMALARGAIGLPIGIGPVRGVALPESATVRRLE
jgi:NADH-quinone oxidoreductase subunit G